MIGKNQRRAVTIILGLILVFVVSLLVISWSTIKQTYNLAHSTSLDNGTNRTSLSKISQITVGIDPTAIAVNPQKNQLYILNDDNTISIVNSSSGKFISNIKIGFSANYIAFDSKTNKIFLPNEDTGNITVLDASNYNSLANISVGGNPGAIGVDPNTAKVYVYVAGSSSEVPNNIVVVDSGKNKILTNLSANSNVNTIDVNPNTNSIYLAEDSNVMVLDSKKDEIIKNVTIGKDISDLAIDYKLNKIFVAFGNGKRIYVMDGNNNYSLSSVIGNSSDIGKFLAASPNTSRVYVVNDKANTLSVIDTKNNKLISTTNKLPRENNPVDIAINRDTNKIYILNNLKSTSSRSSGRPGSISIIEDKTNDLSLFSSNSSQDIPGIRVGKDPLAVYINPNTNLIYVANSGSNSISVIDGSFDRLLTTIKAKGIVNPVALSLNPNTNKIYILNGGPESGFKGGNLTILNATNNNFINNIQVGRNPSSLAIDDQNTVFVASNITTVIDGLSDTLIKKISTIDPYAISINNDSGMIYITEISARHTLAGALYSAFRDDIFETSTNLRNVTINNDTTGKSILLNGVLDNETLSRNISFFDVLDGGKMSGKLVMRNEDDPDGSFVINGVLTSPHVLGKGRSMSVDHFLINGIFRNGTSNVFDNITVGGSPRAIAVNPTTNKVYVANSDSGTVSVIDPYVAQTNEVGTIIKNITVGKFPRAIAVNSHTGNVYVANYFSDSVSVIDGSNDTLVSTIRVGGSPRAIAVNPTTNKVYVANSDSDTVSVIDGLKNQLVAGVTFNISPLSSGHIKCNNEEVPTNKYVYLESGTNCIAESNGGFQFSSWNENLGENSTQNIIPVTKISFWYTPIVDWFKSLVDFIPLNIFQEDSSSSFSITKFGSFTANFEKVPPPLPPEYWATLFTVVVTSLVGSWFIPNAIGWFKSRKQHERLRHHVEIIELLDRSDKSQKNTENKALFEIKKKIAETYEVGKQNDGNENYLKDLDYIKDQITNAYAAGKLDELQYGILDKKLSASYHHMFIKKISSLNGEIDLGALKNDITSAYAEGNINELHYTLLKEKINDYEKHN